MSHHNKSSYADPSKRIRHEKKQKYQTTLTAEVLNYIISLQVVFLLYPSCTPSGVDVIMSCYQNTSDITEAALISPSNVTTKPVEHRIVRVDNFSIFLLLHHLQIFVIFRELHLICSDTMTLSSYFL